MSNTLPYSQPMNTISSQNLPDIATSGLGVRHAAPISSQDSGEARPNLSGAYFRSAQVDLMSLRQSGPRPASDWKRDLQPDPSAPQQPPVRGSEELRRSLAVDGNWKGAEQAKKLLQVLQSSMSVITDRFGPSFQEPAQNPEESMQRLAERLGVSTLNQVCATLLQFLDTAVSKGWKQWEAVRLVRFALEDVGDPSIIDQRSKGSCGAVAVQTKLAAERPLQYVQMLTQLALEQNYRAPDGKVVKPNTTWKGDQSDDRRPSDKIMQSTLMGMAKNYDSSKDDGVNNTGLSREAQSRILQSLLGDTQDLDRDFSTFETAPEKRYLWRLIEDDLARGRTVNVSFDGHAVQVVGVDKTTTPTNVLIMTWGKRMLMPLPRFLQHVQSVASIDDSGLDNRKVEGRKVNS